MRGREGGGCWRRWRRAVRMVSGRRLYLHVLDRRPVLFYESQYFTRQLDSVGRSPLNCLHTGPCLPLANRTTPYVYQYNHHPCRYTRTPVPSQRTPHQHSFILILARNSIALFAMLRADLQHAHHDQNGTRASWRVSIHGLTSKVVPTPR